MQFDPQQGSPEQQTEALHYADLRLIPSSKIGSAHDLGGMPLAGGGLVSVGVKTSEQLQPLPASHSQEDWLQPSH